MSLTAQGKKMASRSRGDSPAPRCAAASPVVVKQSHEMCNNTQMSAPPLSSLASLLGIALLFGCAALYAEELLGNSSTWTALLIFLMAGAVIMHFDFIDAVKEETEKEGVESIHQFSLTVAGRYWLILGSGVTPFVVLTVGWCYGFSQAGLAPLLYSQATNLKDALFHAIAMPSERTAPLANIEFLGDTATWAALAIFLVFGAVAMWSDFVDAVKEEEEEEEAAQPMDDSSLIPDGRCWPILGCGVALVLALTVAWWQGSTQCGPSFIEELHMHSTSLKDSLFVTIALLLFGDTPTWTALVVFLMFGAVVMRFDFVDAVQEEAAKEGFQSMEELFLIPAGRCWLILVFGVTLALAGACRWHISGQMSEEVAIFFLSAALIIGLATTVSTSPKSRMARAFTSPARFK